MLKKLCYYKVVLLLKIIVKSGPKKNRASYLYHAPNQTYFCEGHNISCTKMIVWLYSKKE